MQVLFGTNNLGHCYEVKFNLKIIVPPKCILLHPRASFSIMLRPGVDYWGIFGERIISTGPIVVAARCNLIDKTTPANGRRTKA